MINKLLIFLHLFNAVSALGGSIYLVNGGYMPQDFLRYSPFNSFLIPGLILGFVVCGSGLISFLLFTINNSKKYYISLFAGIIMCGWIVCELLIIRVFSWLQVFYFLTGFVVLLLSFKKIGK